MYRISAFYNAVFNISVVPDINIVHNNGILDHTVVANINFLEHNGVLYFSSYIVTDAGDTPLTKGQVINDEEYQAFREKYEKGFEINIPAELVSDTIVAGARLQDGRLLTDGGRVLGAVSVANTLEDSIKSAYEKAARISFDGAYYRTDIGARALKALK